ncbi:MAG: hypothetical protein AB7I59_07585 [Geminicoccaceae bacterium]
MIVTSNGRHSSLPLVLALLALVLGSLAVAGCNTLSGAGEDAENAVDAAKDAVD